MLALLEAFILLLVIMDPLVSLGALASMTRQQSEGERRKIALKAVLVAALVFFLFAFGGSFALQVLGVSLESFRAAGGIVLVLLGVQMAMGLSLPKKEDMSELAVVIGTPLISGPATISATVLLVKDIGLFSTLAAGTAALLLVMVVLLFAVRIEGVLGRGGVKVLSTMMGIVTIAWGLQFLLGGISGFLGLV